MHKCVQVLCGNVTPEKMYDKEFEEFLMFFYLIYYFNISF